MGAAGGWLVLSPGGRPTGTGLGRGPGPVLLSFGGWPVPDGYDDAGRLLCGREWGLV